MVEENIKKNYICVWLCICCAAQYWKSLYFKKKKFFKVEWENSKQVNLMRIPTFLCKYTQIILYGNKFLRNFLILRYFSAKLKWFVTLLFHYGCIIIIFRQQIIAITENWYCSLFTRVIHQTIYRPCRHKTKDCPHSRRSNRNVAKRPCFCESVSTMTTRTKAHRNRCRISRTST